MHARDGVVPVGLELRDIDCADAVGLDGVDVDDEAFLLGGQSFFTHPGVASAFNSLTSMTESSLATEDGAMLYCDGILGMIHVKVHER